MTYRHFTLDEFACKHCGANHTLPELIEKLDRARALADIPFVISSGYRCTEHNAAVKGVPNSSHTKGMAADINCLTSKARYKILEALLAVGFNRIGVSENFIHVDIDPSKPSRVIWVY